MKTIGILVWKEFRHLINDPISLRLMIFPVFFMVLVLGYAITTEVRNTPVVICDRSDTPKSRELVTILSHHRLFVFKGLVGTELDIRRALDAGIARIGVAIPRDFDESVGRSETARIGLFIDGQDANSSNVAAGYIRAIVQGWMINEYERKLAAMGKSLDELLPVTVRPSILFNPLCKSTWYMVPAMAVLLVTMISALLTGFAVVREKENGTLEQLLVTPLHTVQLVIGKSVPFLIVGFVELFLVLLFAKIWFLIPFRGNYLVLFFFALIYMFSSIGIGILTSTVSRTPYQALFLTWFVLLFFILLSGFFLPLENMPLWVQKLTIINPVRWFMDVVREIFLKGSGLRDLWRQAVAMISIGVVVYSCALVSFKRRIG